MCIPSLVQGGFQFGDVLRAPHLHRDVDHCISKNDTVVRTVVESLDNVGLMVGDHSRESHQRARMVRQVHSDAQQAPVFYQTALDNSESKVTSMFPPLMRTPTFFPS